jgi:hypothetical protein
MALDPTARTTNIKDSIQKYFVDNVWRTSKIHLTFDKALNAPLLQGQKKVNRWVSIKVDELSLETLSTQVLSIYCCARKDKEGFIMAQVVDAVMGYLTDITQTDSFARIPFYRSYEGAQEWTLLGALLVTDVDISGELEAPDETKFRILTVRLRFASKV